MSGWIAWNGGEYPVAGETLVDVEFRCGERSGASSASTWDWRHHSNTYDIVAYRVIDEAKEEPYQPFTNIRNWAKDRNLIEGSTPDKQFIKLSEEFGELAAALARNKQAEVEDAIGDIVVVLTILAAQRGTTIEKCIEGAWDEIKDRRGVMRDGVFVKEDD